MKHAGDFFYSTVTGIKYRVTKRIKAKPLGCKSSNIIYLFTCNCCGIQYVGRTIEELHKRINKYRSQGASLQNKSGGKISNPLVAHHFWGSKCNPNNMCIQPIEQIYITQDDLNKLTVDTALDLFKIPLTQAELDILTVPRASEMLLRAKEDLWISTLRTHAPFGLNAKYEFSPIPDNITVSSTFQTLPRRRGGNKTGGARGTHQNFPKKKFDPQEFFSFLTKIPKLEAKFAIFWRYTARANINCLNKKTKTSLPTLAEIRTIGNFCRTREFENVLRRHPVFPLGTW